jgi:tungstate transport system substrate-binding protein
MKLTAGTTAAVALAPACSKRDAAPAPVASAPMAPAVDSTRIRVASVPTAVEGDLLPELVHEFLPRVELSGRPDVYDAARAGKVDLVISHYGHHDTERFVLDGLGEWPRTVFSNQMALVGPPSDPAKIRGLSDAAEALRRIADTKSLFVMNDLEGIRYLTEILWNAAGRPSRDGWFVDDKQQKEGAMRFASEHAAYTFWGLTPFLRTHKTEHLQLEPLVFADPLLQRLMVSVVVRVPGSNLDGARALQTHLLEPATQAKIRATRYAGNDHIYWVPAGRNNGTAALPISS